VAEVHELPDRDRLRQLEKLCAGRLRAPEARFDLGVTSGPPRYGRRSGDQASSGRALNSWSRQMSRAASSG
jgi:hypothetical protein